MIHDIDTVSDCRTDLAERFYAGLDFLRRDVTTVGSYGERIERPNLHRGDAHIEQRLRELRWPSDEGDLVLVRSRGGFIAAVHTHQAPAAPCLVVGVAGTGVIDADLLTREATQQLVHRTV